MDYIKEYKTFISSHYLGDGVRITAGVVLPAVIFNHFNLLAIGVVVALGAMSVSITDSPGPIHHRKNAMLACIGINTVVAMLTGFAANNMYLLGLLILLACFTFSMIGVYGTRANSVGVSALLIMVLSIGRHHQGWDVLINSVYILAGGIWYMLLSLALYSFRPYKLAQQALGDCISSTADYMRVRADFYKQEVDYDKTYQKMLEQQVVVHEKQNLVRELLFKSRNIVKESTNTGRTLLMIFTDTVDLFEITMTSYHDYKLLHDAFEEDDILERYRQLIIALSQELDEVGIAVQAGNASEDDGKLAEKITALKSYFEDFRDSKRTAANLDHFVSLRHILNSISDIANRIHTLHLYTTYDKALTANMPKQLDYDQFISHQEIDADLLVDNLSMKSNTFRHALRVSIATLAGYIISLFFPLGHGYWILLTIIVILKPAYSLTKKRNYERLSGTVIGAAIGLLILFFIHQNQVLFFIMLFLMIGTYSFVRSNYMIGVIFMTPYILLLFHLLNNDNFKMIITDRIIDTAIGSAIAFFANLLLVPAWEHEKISDYMKQAIKSNRDYFAVIAAAFTGNTATNTVYKLSRKNAFVALANLSDAFTRMLSEPKSKQLHSKELHQFVVLNHMLTSHIATLSYYVKPLAERFQSADFVPLVTNISNKLELSETLLLQTNESNNLPAPLFENKIQERLQQLLEKRRNELKQGIEQSDTRKLLSSFKPLADQFNFIDNISTDIKKLSAAWQN